MPDAANFLGRAPRECGDYRTVGSHRAWCLDCSEWCYPRIPCKGCEALSLRDQRDRAVRALAEESEESRFGPHPLIYEAWAQEVLAPNGSEGAE